MSKKLSQVPLSLLLDLFLELTERQCELRDRQDILDTSERQELEDLGGMLRGMKSYVRRRQALEQLKRA